MISCQLSEVQQGQVSVSARASPPPHGTPEAWWKTVCKAACWKRTWATGDQLAEHEPVCCQVVRKANSILACIITIVTSRSRAVSIPLYLVLVRLHAESGVHFWAPNDKKELEVLQRIEKRGRNLVKSLEHSWDGEQLRELEGSIWRTGGSGETFSLSATA